MQLRKSFFRPFRRNIFSSKEDTLEKNIGYSFKDQNLKTLALTHKSFANENGDLPHNERLEFLGDAVFDLFVSDILMKKYPEADEGDLSKMRASLVNTDTLAELALSLNLDQHLKLGVSEARDRGQLKPRLLACVLEALVGAVYLDGGHAKAKKMVVSLVGEKIKSGLENKDYKSILQEFVQKKFRKIPVYTTIDVTGPQHEKMFLMKVQVGDRVLGKGEGKSKKQATQLAALAALKELEVFPFT